MESPATVASPDPVATAAAQTASNKDTAITQAGLNNYDKISPDGSLTYTSTPGPNGVPHYTQTTSLSAPNQGIYDTNLATKQNISDIGKAQSAKIGDLLGTPFDINNAVSDKITSLGKTRLDPQWAARDSAQEAKLANSGITPGSEAYDNAMRSYNSAKNDAYNSLYLSGEGQAASESIAQRNQPINEITALLNGTQVGTPTFAANPQTSVAGTDVAGITQNSYLDANQQAQQAVAGQNATMGGLFSLGGTLGTAAIKYSDRRLKQDISRVGTLDNGLPVYLYRYKSGGPFELGLMADEVRPDAVHVDVFGYKMVDYAKAAVSRGVA